MPSGTSTTAIMSKAADVSEENVIEVTEADLKDDQKEELDKYTAQFRKACLQSFSRSRSGETIKKTPFPAPRQITISEDSAQMADMIQQSIYHAFVDQSPVLSNMVHNAVVNSFAGGIPQGYRGPAYFQPIPPNQNYSNSVSQPIQFSVGSSGASSSSTPMGYGSIQLSSAPFPPVSPPPWGAPSATAGLNQSASQGNPPFQASSQAAIRPIIPPYQPVAPEVNKTAALMLCDETSGSF